MAIIKRTIAVASLIVLLAAGLWAATSGYTLRQRLNAKASEGWMRNLWAVCESGSAHDLAGVLEECRRQGATCEPRDAWGNEFIVERTQPRSDGSRGCRVISLGRDGRRGNCCAGNVGWRWDEDAVYEDARFVQDWNWMESGRRQASGKP